VSAASGRPFPKGKSGNPRGRPKQTQEDRDFRKYVREHGAVIAERLLEIVKQRKSPQASVHAARAMLDYAIPRPKQTVEVHETGPSPRALEVRALLKVLSKEEIEAQIAFVRSVAERARLAETAGTDG
jgi:hypothetical protein